MQFSHQCSAQGSFWEITFVSITVHWSSLGGEVTKFTDYFIHQLCGVIPCNKVTYSFRSLILSHTRTCGTHISLQQFDNSRWALWHILLMNCSGGLTKLELTSSASWPLIVMVKFVFCHSVWIVLFSPWEQCVVGSNDKDGAETCFTPESLWTAELNKDNNQLSVEEIYICIALTLRYRWVNAGKM